MSLAHEPAAVPLLSAPARTGLVLIALWAVIGGALVAGHRPVMEAMSTDDLMRLVQVRDYLAGQAWSDLAQHRLDPPGVVLHWSRLVDLPLAAAMAALMPLVGGAHAEIVVATAWPVLLLLPVLMLAALMAERLGGTGARLPAILLLATTTPVLVHFRPGALDHHGVQLLLLLVAAWGATARRDGQGIAIGGGLAAALSLAVGVETAPALAALAGALGLRWVVEGQPAAGVSAAFGSALSGASAVLFALTTPPSAFGAPVCDALSIVWVVAAALAGGALVLLPAFGAGLSSWPARAGAGAAAGFAAVYFLWLLFPRCLGDPYGALDARLAMVWLAHVMEAQSIAGLARVLPGEVLPLYAPCVGALVLGAVVLVRSEPDARAAWFGPLAALLALFLVSLWQMRGAAGALAISAPVIAGALVHLFGTRALGRLPALLLLVLLSYPALSIIGQGTARALHALDPHRPAITDDGRHACRRASDFRALAVLPTGPVLAMIDLGPAILAHTAHAILAAPYHRNVFGNGAALEALLGDDAAVRRVLHDKGIRYVALCARSPESANYAAAAPRGLAARLAAGQVPAFLEPLSAPGTPLQLYRVPP